VPQVAAEEMWEGMHRGLLRAATEGHYRRYWNGPSHSDDIERQIAIVEKQLAFSPKGLVLAPDHASALISTVVEAQKRHIPVVLMESELAIPMGAGVVTVETDNQRAGAMAADYIARALEHKGSVVMVGINPADTSNFSRAEAFQQSLFARYPQVHLVDRRFSGASIDETEVDIEQALDQHPDLNAILASNVTSTRAAQIVLARQHLTGKVLLVGFDQDRDIEDMVRHGEVDAIVAQDSDQIGYLAGRAIIDMNAGRPVAPRTLIEPHLFTRTNIDSTEAQRILVTYSGWDTSLCTFCRARSNDSQ
jgi:ribose transport system substrate-binding protein